MTTADPARPALFAVMSRPTALWRADPGILASHQAFLRDLEERGVTFLSGPLGINNAGWHGHGLTIIRAASLDDARELMAAEPYLMAYLMAGLRTHDITPWMITSGRIVMSTRVSDQASSVT